MDSEPTSDMRRPINRFTEKKVFSGFTTAWRLAICAAPQQAVPTVCGHPANSLRCSTQDSLCNCVYVCGGVWVCVRKCTTPCGLSFAAPKVPTTRVAVE